MNWLIDGHNLIGHMPNLQLADADDEEKLLEHLRRYQAQTGHSLTVIFDPGQTYHSAKTQKRGGITVQFASSGQTADQIIIQRLRQVKNPQTMSVVTSDRAVQQAARWARVRVVTAPEFTRQLLRRPADNNLSEDDGKQINIRLTPDELDDWLTLFKQPKDGHT